MISPKDLEELANLYDEGAQSLDPLDPRSLQALDEFEKKVEDIFRTSKSILETRPIYHRCNEPIRGHVFCSFLASASLRIQRVKSARAT